MRKLLWQRLESYLANAGIWKFGQRKSKTFDSNLQAVKWAKEIEQTLNPGDLIQGKTVGDAFPKFRDEITPTRKSHRSEHNRMNKFMRDPMSDPDALY